MVSCTILVKVTNKNFRCTGNGLSFIGLHNHTLKSCVLRNLKLTLQDLDDRGASGYLVSVDFLFTLSTDNWLE